MTRPATASILLRADQEPDVAGLNLRLDRGTNVLRADHGPAKLVRVQLAGCRLCHTFHLGHQGP